MGTPETEDFVRLDAGFTAVQNRTWRIFIGACVLSVIIVIMLVVLSARKSPLGGVVISLAALLLWSGVVTVYSFHSLHLAAQRLKDQLARSGFVDELTGVFNFRYLDRRLAEESERIKRYGSMAAILYVDVDHFKRVNDEYGRHLGNVVLRHIAAMLSENMRSCDVLARVGGDEFVVLLPQTARKEALALGQRLSACVAGYRLELGERGAIDSVRASVGVSVCPEDGDTMEAVVGAADRAVREAKRNGGNAARDARAAGPSQDTGPDQAAEPAEAE